MRHAVFKLAPAYRVLSIEFCARIMSSAQIFKEMFRSYKNLPVALFFHVRSPMSYPVVY
jgi:hypothetical protein